MTHSEFNKDFRKILKEYIELYKDFNKGHYNSWKFNVVQFGQTYGKEEVCWFLEREKDVDIIGNNRITFISNKFTKFILPIIVTLLTGSLITEDNTIRNILTVVALIFVAIIIVIAMNAHFNAKYAIQEKFYDDCLDILRN